MSDDIEKLVAAFEAGIRGKPNYARNLAGLAELVAKRKDKPRAYALARRALAEGGGDPEVVARSRAVLNRLLASYHVPMMNDARRNAAWDKALRAAIRPGMQVFEIGTGAGMLALMAARAGADHVYTCESDPLLAELARALAARNGLADRITVIARPAQKVRLGADLPRRADLLFCDIFADDLFGFQPLALIADAQARLLVPDAPVVPMAASLHVALARWDHYGSAGHLEAAAGFDLSPLADFAPAARGLTIGDPALHLMSPDSVPFRFVLGQGPHPAGGAAEAICTASRDGTVNGIARWIRLELDADTALEARPEPGTRFFSSPMFCPLAAPMAVQAGDRLRIATRYQDKRVDTWLAGRG